MNQQQALDILKLGHNVYLTGSAGSGKTFLLNNYIGQLKEKGVAVGITASTGIAATHLQGITIHSWSGIGIREELSVQDINAFFKKRHLHRRYLETKVLVIDEVSMIHSYYLDLVDFACRALKKSDRPFGGLQVVLCGDFFQLPPVSKNGSESKFAPQADVWAQLKLKVCYLDGQYRQQDDQLVKILNQIRTGQAQEETLEILNSRFNRPVPKHSALTKLYTHNADVDEINTRQLNSLPGKTYRYQMRRFGRAKLVNGLVSGCLAPEELLLKKNSAVMFVKNNFEQGYFNGTLGTVVDFDNKGFPVVQTAAKKIIALPVSWVIEEDGQIGAEIMQVPLRLAWAITVHKSQGMSLDAAEIDLSKSFEPGMGYVALSRVKSLNGIRLVGLNKTALLVNEEILKLDKDFKILSAQATAELEKLNRDELAEKQKSFLDSIIPDVNEPKKRKKKIPGATYEETKKLVAEKMSIKDIAAKRGLTAGTIMNHLEKLVRRGEKLDLAHLAPPAERLKKIKRAFEKSNGVSLMPVREILGDGYSYDELRLVRLFLDENLN